MDMQKHLIDGKNSLATIIYKVLQRFSIDYYYMRLMIKNQ